MKILVVLPRTTTSCPYCMYRTFRERALMKSDFRGGWGSKMHPNNWTIQDKNRTLWVVREVGASKMTPKIGHHLCMFPYSGVPNNGTCTLIGFSHFSTPFKTVVRLLDFDFESQKNLPILKCFFRNFLYISSKFGFGVFVVI